MPRHHLIEAHLRQLRGNLPTDVVEEIADGLLETFDHFRGQGLHDHAAARAALADFGAASDIVAAFTQITPGRRTARALLATGPLLGGCWALALLTGHAWHWPIPTTVRIGFALLLLTAILLLATAARSHFSRPRRGSAVAGSSALILLDTTAITTAALLAPALTWPVALATAASLTRACLTLPALRGLLTSH